MSALLAALFVGAAAGVTWLHLSTRERRKGRPFPSVQHLGGAPLPRRPTWPVEQPVRLLLRLASLLLLALALWGFGRGGGGATARVAIVDPASGAEGWRRARAFQGVGIVAGFESGRAQVEGDDARAARVRLALETCSARTVDCLLRAAHAGEARPVVVSDFIDGAWSAALAGEAFDFVRLPAPAQDGRRTSAEPASGSAEGATSGVTGSGGPRTAGSGPAAAARQTPAGARASATATTFPPLVALWRAALDAALPPKAGERAPPALPALRVLTGPGAAELPCPAVERTEPRPLRWEGLSALATLRSAVPAGATLRFHEAPGTTLALDGLAARTGDGTLCLASTERELGRWAHDGTLGVLGRALQPLVAPPLVVSQAPPGGTERWLATTTGAAASVGLSDVPPGDYRRADGRVLLSQQRPEPLAPAPLTDADLTVRGGAPWPGGTSAHWPWPLWALLGVALLRLLDWPERRADISRDLSRTSQTSRLGLQLASLAILAAAIFGLGWSRVSAAERWMRLLGPTDPEATAAIGSAGLRTVRGNAPLDCAAPASGAPCLEVATAAAGLERGIDTRVRPVDGPRVSLLDVRLPGEVPLGMAAQIRVDVRVQHARGQTVTIAASAPRAPTVREQRPLASDDEVLRLELPLLPAAEGVLPVSVSARAGTEVDGQLRALVVRRRPVRRLLLAGAPSWDARRAAEVLDVSPARVDVITRVGRTASASRPRGLPQPSALLTSPGALDAYASILLVDPGDWLGPDALAGLAAWVERGGGLVILGRSRNLPRWIPGPSPSGPSGPLHRLQASWGGERLSFDGFDPADGGLATGAVVLGESGASERALRPWVVGRTTGQGRVLQFLAEDVWRLSPPGGDATRLAKLLGSAVAWVEAARLTPPVTVAADARSLLWADDTGLHRTPFGLGQAVLGLDVATLPAALDLPIRLRTDAARSGKPWIEASSWQELGQAWGRAPAAPTLRRHGLIRTEPAIWGVWAALLAAEVALRRGRRRPSLSSESDGAPLEVEPLRRAS